MRRWRSVGVAPALLAAAGLHCVGPGPPVPPGPPVVELTDSDNFQYEAQLTVTSQTLQTHADSLLRWDELTRDVHGRPIDPYLDTDGLTLLLFPDLSPEEVAHGLVHDQLQQADIGAYVLCESQHASCLLSEFGIQGVDPEIQQYFEEGRGTWLVFVNPTDGAGGLSFLFLAPSVDSFATEASFIDAGSALELDVDLRSLTPRGVPLDGEVEFRWAGLERDGLGNELSLYKLDRLFVARYEGLGLPDLEDRFYDIEVLADEIWEQDVDGVTSWLPEGVGTFPGFGGDGTWLLALRCSTCDNPMPRFVTVLEPIP